MSVDERVPDPPAGPGSRRDSTSPLLTASCHTSSSSGIEYQRATKVRACVRLGHHRTICSSVPIDLAAQHAAADRHQDAVADEAEHREGDDAGEHEVEAQPRPRLR